MYGYRQKCYYLIITLWWVVFFLLLFFLLSYLSKYKDLFYSLTIQKTKLCSGFIWLPDLKKENHFICSNENWGIIFEIHLQNHKMNTLSTYNNQKSLMTWSFLGSSKVFKCVNVFFWVLKDLGLSSCWQLPTKMTFWAHLASNGQQYVFVRAEILFLVPRI